MMMSCRHLLNRSITRLISAISRKQERCSAASVGSHIPTRRASCFYGSINYRCHYPNRRSPRRTPLRRSKTKVKPFSSLVAAITAEELGHVELMSTGVAMLNNGPGDPEEDYDLSDAPFVGMQDIRLARRSS